MDTEQLSPDNQLGLERLLDIKQLAAYLGVPVSTVYDWSTRNFCPPAYRFGKHLKFAVSEVREWVEHQHEPIGSAPSGGRRSDEPATLDDRHVR